MRSLRLFLTMLWFLLAGILTGPALGIVQSDLDWWQSAVVYQIYPRSFKDSDGNGIGDLQGIIDSIGYLQELGVRAVWLSPIYPSPGKDFGYDVSDYTSVDPLFGTMDDFEKLAVTLGTAGIKLIMDFVPNHSSDQHEWFKASVNKTKGYEDFYIWKDPIYYENGTKGPPNNWVSRYDGSAWEFNEKRKQYYYHHYLKEQPDLNYANQDVLNAMTDVLSFWMDKGVYGFRMDAVGTLWEDRSFNDEPIICSNATKYNCLHHIYTLDQEQTYSPILKTFRTRLDTYSKRDNITRVMIVEPSSNDWSKLMEYYTVAHFPFNFHLIFDVKINNGSDAWFNAINAWIQHAGINWSNWVTGNHDQHRTATRLGADLVDAVNMLVLLLKGTAVTYNGEEIGMLNSFVRWDQARDPRGKTGGMDVFLSQSRDPQRGPLLWDSSPNAGFTSAQKPWLPVQAGYVFDNIAAQQATNKSHLSVYKRMVRIRQSYVWKFGNCEFYKLSSSSLGVFREAYDNPTIMALINFGLQEEVINLQKFRSSMPPIVYVFAESVGIKGDDTGNPLYSSQIHLPPRSGVVLFSQPLNVSIKANRRMVKPWDWI